ncbi:MAG: hypothetical protein L6R37_006520 [Teloschistes peruensis]|nr:MAG: hypothetical protein L6R37_006520 [Teloschistes peruensis]
MSGHMKKFCKAAFGLLSVLPMIRKVNKDGVINSTTVAQDMLANGTLTIDGPNFVTKLSGIPSNATCTPVSGFSSFCSDLVSGSFFWSFQFTVLGLLWHHFGWHILWYVGKWTVTQYCTRFVAAQDIHPLVRWILDIPAAPLDVPDPEEIILTDAFNHHVDRHVREISERVGWLNIRFALYLQHQANRMYADAMRVLLYMYTIVVVAYRAKDQKIIGLRACIERQIQKIHGLEQENIDQRKEHREYRRKIEEEQIEVKFRPNRAAEALQALEKFSKEAKDREEVLNIKLNDRDIEHTRQANMIRQMELNERVLGDRTAQLVAKVDRLQKRNDDLGDKLSDLEDQNAALDKTNGAHVAEKRKLSRSRKRLAEKKGRASATNRQLKKEARKSSVLIADQEETIATMAAMIEKSLSLVKHREILDERDKEAVKMVTDHQEEVEKFEEEHQKEVDELNEERRQEKEDQDAKIAGVEEELRQYRAQVRTHDATADDLARHKMDAERSGKRLSMKVKKEEKARKEAEAKAEEAAEARIITESNAMEAAQQHEAVAQGFVQLTESLYLALAVLTPLPRSRASRSNPAGPSDPPAPPPAGPPSSGNAGGSTPPAPPPSGPAGAPSPRSSPSAPPSAPPSGPVDSSVGVAGGSIPPAALPTGSGGLPSLVSPCASLSAPPSGVSGLSSGFAGVSIPPAPLSTGVGAAGSLSGAAGGSIPLAVLPAAPVAVAPAPPTSSRPRPSADEMFAAFANLSIGPASASRKKTASAAPAKCAARSTSHVVAAPSGKSSVAAPSSSVVSRGAATAVKAPSPAKAAPVSKAPSTTGLPSPVAVTSAPVPAKARLTAPAASSVVGPRAAPVLSVVSGSVFASVKASSLVAQTAPVASVASGRTPFKIPSAVQASSSVFSRPAVWTSAAGFASRANPPLFSAASVLLPPSLGSARAPVQAPTSIFSSSRPVSDPRATWVASGGFGGPLTSPSDAMEGVTSTASQPPSDAMEGVTSSAYQPPPAAINHSSSPSLFCLANDTPEEMQGITYTRDDAVSLARSQRNSRLRMLSRPVQIPAPPRQQVPLPSVPSSPLTLLKRLHARQSGSISESAERRSVRGLPPRPIQQALPTAFQPGYITESAERRISEGRGQLPPRVQAPTSTPIPTPKPATTPTPTPASNPRPSQASWSSGPIQPEPGLPPKRARWKINVIELSDAQKEQLSRSR